MLLMSLRKVENSVANLRGILTGLVLFILKPLAIDADISRYNTAAKLPTKSSIPSSESSLQKDAGL